jgi:subtilisin family serine protease
MRKINSILVAMLIGVFLISPTLAKIEKEDYSEFLAIAANSPEANAMGGDITGKVIEKISNRENIPGGQLEVLKTANIGFELTNSQLTEIKVLDKESGKIYGIAVDSKGNEANKGKLEKQEEAAYQKKYGKKTKRLHEELSKKRDTDRVKVGIWISDNKLLSPSKVGNVEGSSKSNIEAIEASVVKNIKNKKGRIIYASQYAPLIYAELSKKDIKAIESREDVIVIDKEGIAEPEIDSAVPTIRANLVWPYNTGSGVNVAVVEYDGIAFANPYITKGTYYRPSTPNIGWHATMVAGIIAGTDATYKGVAPGASLLSANSMDYVESSLIEASDWALSRGANVLSLSWGIESDGYLHVMDKYYDYVSTRYPYPTIVKSAGNIAGHITTPGNGWNVIAVGAVDDQNTDTWDDDIMAPYSSYVDPISPHADREKPEVSAVGSRIKSTLNNYPWIPSAESQGTSFAAPAVSGVAALLMSKNPTLKSWPETIRAVIFASAIHNIEGASMLSKKDGMGAVVANEAFNVVARDQVKNNIIYSTMTYPIIFSIYAPAGKKVRAAMSWDSKSTGAYGTDSLKADFDMLIRKPGGIIVGFSASYDNNYEIVEFIAPITGTYTVEINKLRWDAGNPFEWLGFAYSIT